MSAETFGWLYLWCGLATAFFSSLYFGKKDGNWGNWNRDPGRFFAPIGLGLIWPATAVTFLPFYFGVKLNERKERLENEAKKREAIEEQQRKADERLLQLDTQRRASAAVQRTS